MYTDVKVLRHNFSLVHNDSNLAKHAKWNAQIDVKRVWTVPNDVQLMEEATILQWQKCTNASKISNDTYTMQGCKGLALLFAFDDFTIHNDDKLLSPLHHTILMKSVTGQTVPHMGYHWLLCTLQHSTSDRWRTVGGQIYHYYGISLTLAALLHCIPNLYTNGLVMVPNDVTLRWKIFWVQNDCM